MEKIRLPKRKPKMTFLLSVSSKFTERLMCVRVCVCVHNNGDGGSEKMGVILHHLNAFVVVREIKVSLSRNKFSGESNCELSKRQ